MKQSNIQLIFLFSNFHYGSNILNINFDKYIDIFGYIDLLKKIKGA